MSPTISGGAAAAGAGTEIGYAQITAAVNIVSTTEATGTAIIAPGALTFDGAAVLCQFFAPALVDDIGTAGDVVIVSLFEGAAQIGRLVVTDTLTTTTTAFVTVAGFLRFTPTAGAHTYTVTAFATSVTGTPRVVAGAGGTGAYVPAFVRFTKV